MTHRPACAGSSARRAKMPGIARHLARNERESPARSLVGAAGMFFDMDQDHEAWFTHAPSGWMPAAPGCCDTPTSTNVIPLGVDHDSRPPYEDNYGRTLFGCVRRQD